MKDSIAPLLLAWYDRHARALPWRSAPGGPPPDPYRVWLSEIMLQQTTVAAVAPRFEAFVARWPDVEALARAREAEVLAAWAGLGYYARARKLHACARQVVARGGFPADEAGWRALPGIGAYTAAAMAAIALGQRAVVVDANVERVVARLFAITDPLPGARAAIRAAADAITPALRAGDFAQGMMDLGATICTARMARCDECPLASACQARAMGAPERIPIKAPRPARPLRQGTTFWIERAGQVWLVERPARGMLAGMRALPDDGWSARQDGSGEAPLPGRWHRAGMVRHLFTHAELHLVVMVLEGAAEPAGPGQWWPLAGLAEAGLPSLFARASRLALDYAAAHDQA